MEQDGKLNGVVEYATNDLEIMVPIGNPKHIESLEDLARRDIRLSMPNPRWEGVANQIAASLRKAGGEKLYRAIYRDKVKSGQTSLTEIHHRQTPMRIMSKQVDAGVTWTSEVRFQESIGNPIQGVAIPPGQNATAIYAGGVLKKCPTSRNRRAVAGLSEEPGSAGRVSTIRVPLGIIPLGGPLCARDGALQAYTHVLSVGTSLIWKKWIGASGWREPGELVVSRRVLPTYEADGLVHPGKFVRAELMVKDAQRYKHTDGWGWGRWRGLDLKPYGEDPRFVQQ